MAHSLYHVRTAHYTENAGQLYTSKAIAACNASLQALQPSRVGLCLFENDRMALLEDLMNGDEGLESLDFVGKNRLPGGRAVSSGKSVLAEQFHLHFHARPERVRVLVVPCVNNAAADMLSYASVRLWVLWGLGDLRTLRGGLVWREC